VRAIIFLDASVDNAEAHAKLAKEPAPASPPPLPMDHLFDSFATVRAFVLAQIGIDWPVGEILANVKLDANRRILGEMGHPEAGSKIIAGTVAYDYTRITCPALVLLAEPPPMAEQIGSAWARLDDAGRAAWLAFEPKQIEFWQEQRTRVTAELRGVQVVAYPDSHHYVFVQRQREVIADIQKFLASLPAIP
jgi:pimeloyl-ACP methyl ester carboxylesterase